MTQADAPCRFVAGMPAELEHRWQTQRHRDDRLAVIALITVLMQAQAIAGFIAVDQASVRPEIAKACGRSGEGRQFDECRWQHGPGLLTERIDRAVPIAATVTDPPQRPTVGQTHGHVQAAGGEHMPERRAGDDLAQLRQQHVYPGQGKTGQHHRLFTDPLWFGGAGGVEQIQFGLHHDRQFRQRAGGRACIVTRFGNGGCHPVCCGQSPHFGARSVSRIKK
ncbi:hypothetical protein D3C80_870960 [compost metagenome]